MYGRAATLPHLIPNLGFDVLHYSDKVLLRRSSTSVVSRHTSYYTSGPQFLLCFIWFLDLELRSPDLQVRKKVRRRICRAQGTRGWLLWLQIGRVSSDPQDKSRICRYKDKLPNLTNTPSWPVKPKLEFVLIAG